MTVATQQKLVERIWARDATVWTGADEDKWLGWLDEPIRMQERAGESAHDLRARGLGVAREIAQRLDAHARLGGAEVTQRGVERTR